MTLMYRRSPRKGVGILTFCRDIRGMEFVEQTGAPCISKPFDFNDVCRVIGRVFGNRSTS